MTAIIGWRNGCCWIWNFLPLQVHICPPPTINFLSSNNPAGPQPDLNENFNLMARCLPIPFWALLFVNHFKLLLLSMSCQFSQFCSFCFLLSFSKLLPTLTLTHIPLSELHHLALSISGFTNLSAKLLESPSIHLLLSFFPTHFPTNCFYCQCSIDALPTLYCTASKFIIIMAQCNNSEFRTRIVMLLSCNGGAKKRRGRKGLVNNPTQAWIPGHIPAINIDEGKMPTSSRCEP